MYPSPSRPARRKAGARRPPTQPARDPGIKDHDTRHAGDQRAVASREPAHLIRGARPARHDRLVGEVAPQVVGQSARRGVAVARLLLERLRDDRLQVATQLRRDAPQPRRGAQLNRDKCLGERAIRAALAGAVYNVLNKE